MNWVITDEIITGMQQLIAGLSSPLLGEDHPPSWPVSPRHRPCFSCSPDTDGLFDLVITTSPVYTIGRGLGLHRPNPSWVLVSTDPILPQGGAPQHHLPFWGC